MYVFLFVLLILMLFLIVGQPISQSIGPIVTLILLRTQHAKHIGAPQIDSGSILTAVSMELNELNHILLTCLFSVVF